MDTRIDEIADGLFRLSTFVPQVAPPAGFTFNQFLVLGDEPLLFHTGMRQLFPAVGAALRAGTNCGSCRPEIRGLIAANTACRTAAE